MNDIAIIIRINAFAQREQPPLTLDDKPVYSVALDRSCTFKDFREPEIVLTNDQLMCLFGQTFLSSTFQ